MSICLNRNIEILEPLLLMSATAIDSADAEVLDVALGAEDAQGAAFAEAQSLAEGDDSLFAAADDQTALVDPVLAEAPVDLETFETIDFDAIDIAPPEAQSVLVEVAVCTLPIEALPPVAVHDYNFTVAGESVSGSVLCNDINPSGATLSAWVQSGPANGSLCFQPDGTYEYTPNPGYCGMDTFIYVITDGNGGVSSTSVCIEIGEPVETVTPQPAPVNLAPVAVDDSATTAFETVVEGNVLANDSDPENDALQAWVEIGPSNGSIEMNPDGSFVYSPDPGFSGSDSFTYSVNDVEGNTTIATVSLEVEPGPVNVAPIAVDDAATTAFESSVEGNVLTNDSDAEGDALQAWVETGPSNGSIEMNPDGSFIYTPNPGFSGTDTFTYSVTDVEGNCSVATVTLEVGEGPVNTAPIALDDAATTAFETSVEGNLLTNDSDAEGDALQAWVEVGPSHGSIELNPDGSYVYIPDPGFSGTDTFTYSVTDVEGNSSLATVTVEVGEAPVNTGPVAVDDAASGSTGNDIAGNVLSNDFDLDGDTLSAAPITDFVTAEGGTVALKQDGTFVYEPAEGYVGFDSFTYVVTDADGNSATATVAIDVRPAPLIVQDDSYSVTNNGGVITGNVSDNDGPNNGNVIVRLVEGPASGSLVFGDDGTFEYQAESGFSGRDSFQYVLVRNCQTSEIATATLIVTKVQYDQTHESAGNGRVWGDPHFEGDDGGLYDVQGEAGKTYSLLSDLDLQVNALFIPWEIHPGSTMMGAIGVTSGADQIVADLTETTVNGVVIEAGQTIQIEDGTVSYDGQYTTITTDEYELELNRRDGWYDMKLKSLDPFRDNVAPHGLWGLTVDADTDARDGDFFRTQGFDYTLQGGGAIDTIDATGEIVRTQSGDRSAYQLYETADLLSLEALNSEADILFRFAAAEGTGLSPI